MNIETANALQAQGIKPYHTFPFLRSPFRWLAVFILWNLGCFLEWLGNSIQRNISLVMVAFFFLYIWACCILANLFLTILERILQ